MQVSTNMREAFINSTIKRGTGAAIINSCAKSIKAGAGVMNFGKGWNAALSFQTAKELKAPAFEDAGNEKWHPRQVFTRYERMIQG